MGWSAARMAEVLFLPRGPADGTLSSISEAPVCTEPVEEQNVHVHSMCAYYLIKCHG